jgi:hypothetical protein
MSSAYRIDKRNSLSYEECFALTIENDGGKLVIWKGGEIKDPPKEYNNDYDYGLWDGKNYLHIFFCKTNYVTKCYNKPYRVDGATRYGGNQVEDLLNILGRSTWIG